MTVMREAQVSDVLIAKENALFHKIEVGERHRRERQRIRVIGVSWDF